MTPHHQWQIIKSPVADMCNACGLIRVLIKRRLWDYWRNGQGHKRGGGCR